MASQKKVWYENVYVWDKDCWSCKKPITVLLNSSEYYVNNTKEGISMVGSLHRTTLKKIANKYDVKHKTSLDHQNNFAVICEHCEVIQGSFYLNQIMFDSILDQKWVDKYLVYSRKKNKN